MTKINRSLLMLSLLLGSQMMAGVAAVLAGDLTLENTRDFKSQNLDQGNFERSKLTFTADARVGYDDNSLAQPDSVKTVVVDPVTFQRRTVTQNPEDSDSAFVNFDFGASYVNATPRAKISVSGDVGVSYYFDRPGRDYDVNGGVDLAFSYKLTPRATLNLTSYNAYTSEPDFGASNLTGFNGNNLNTVNNASGNTSADRQNGDFFFTTNSLSLAYQWTPRFSTVTGYNLVAFAYKDDPYTTVEDRVEHYFDQQFRFLVTPTLTAVAEYRFGYVDYFGVSNDSFLHFALAGVDVTISQRLRGTLRAGAEFRNYYSYDDGTNISPYVEANLTYDLSRLAHLNFIARYSDEEGNITANNNDANTLRLGVAYDQTFGVRLNAYVSFYYTHSEFHGADTFLTQANGSPVIDLSGNEIVVYPGNFDENTFDVAAGVRYAFNRIISAEVGYTHTTVLSGIDIREYDRNRYFGGIHINF